ncbi:GTPase Era [Clostridium tepidiprofundi DSM 19306]|uniref:GTPase Era n=1 Tax=Clostridium tepidiprofundi DSM 19306 TaxID=1121338 RepID=A0A151AV16_9CLOT|nr:dynamin family protein [Clostridium tepidiprofundi]KYH31390.1 GTPase Era [Clostridium tepidiprofundi DSM 19306]
MTEVFIKYNPYKVETIIKIDGQDIASGSKLASFKHERLQVWLDQLIPELSEELNEDNFKIIFHGTNLDYEDVKEICNSYTDIEIELEHISAKNSKDKIQELSNLIDYMQEGPFEEFKDKKIKENFNKVINSEFEIGVIATMSSGKSTLINAFLGKELMPSKNEACTAKISRIKNIDGYLGFKGRCLDEQRNEVVPFKEIEYEDMNNFNENPMISYIEIEGDIPNISSRKMNLVLVDTPGPNNSQNRTHREHTFSVIKNDTYKPMILYVLNGTQLGTDDDSALLSAVADAMKVGGKQSKDRFIFVINKVDQFDPDKESIPEMIEKARVYLENHGIKNPNIYPTSAEMAKVIRMNKNGYKLTRSQKSTLRNCDLFTDEPSMHLLQYTPLSNTVKNRINETISLFRIENDINNEALYHSGIPYIETAINEYLEKYAVASKITAAVNSFKKIVEERQMIQNIQQEIEKDENAREELYNQMKELEKVIKKGEKSKQFKKKIDTLKFDKYEGVRKIRGKIEQKLLKVSSKFRAEKVSKTQARTIIKEATKELSYLESDIFTDLENMINVSLKESAENLLNEYRNYIKDLVGIKKNNSFKWNNIELFTKNLPDANELIENNKYTEKEKVGERYVVNDNKKWYKPWTWFQKKGWYEDVYETREYVNVNELTRELSYPFKENLYKNIESCISYLNDEEKRLKSYFKNEIQELDNMVLNKAKELKEMSKDSKSLELRIKNEKENKYWLDNFVEKLDNILEI